MTCFAYGMTGAGKTHTMFGTENEYRKELGIANLVIRALLCDETGTFKSVSVSFLEIYNEQVKDLLSLQK